MRSLSARKCWIVLASLAALGAVLFAHGAGAASRQIGSVTLTIAFSGSGAGTVTQISGPGQGTPQGINCTNPPPGLGSVCSETFPFGAPPQPFIGLQASAPAGSEFIGWQVTPDTIPTFDCDSGTICYVQMNDNVTVTAQFQQVIGNVPLQVVRGGTGARNGVVTSSPTGIACGFAHPDCATSFPLGTNVTLTASTINGATFSGWSGACSSAGSKPTCSLTLTGATNVAANFSAPQQQLTVTVAGSGGVASNVPGISCPTTCTASFAQGSQVTLYASAAENYQFTGWSGACTGQSTCVVTLNAATSVTATFVQLTQPLTVSVLTGGGTVASTPGGVSCPTDCLGTFPQGSQVTLNPTAAPGWAFGSWGGACNGSAACTVTMSQAQQVTASFVRTPVAASFVSARVTRNGPAAARRAINVLVSNTQVVGVNIKILRGSSQIKNITFRGVQSGRHLYKLLIRNVTLPGRVQVRVTFTNVARTTKVQARTVTLPRA
jgi:hypothetical protein